MKSLVSLRRYSTFTNALIISGLFLGTFLLTEVAEGRVSRTVADVSSSTVEVSESAITRSVREKTDSRELSEEMHEARDSAARVIEEPYTGPAATHITLRELGLLQLAAHDLFNVDRDTEVDGENGKLDLSTLLAYGEENIAIGGEPRNRENIIIFSVAKSYGEQYKAYRKDNYTHDEALLKLLWRYHNELADVYETVFAEKLPEPTPGEATHTENIALRTIHDFLPGIITVAGEDILTVDESLLGQSLGESELDAFTSVLDGHFDEEFLDVVIIIPPDMVMHISLLERDSSFAEQFGTEHSFEHFMSELEDGSYDSDEDVMYHIRNLFAKGLYFGE